MMPSDNKESPSDSRYAPIILTKEISECTTILEDGTQCKKQIGKPSIDGHVTVCHVHRICNSCKKQITTTEAIHCVDNEISPFRCARCLISEEVELRKSTPDSKVEVSQKYLDELNMARLLLTPSPELGDEALEYTTKLQVSNYFRDMDFDQIRHTVKKWQVLASEAALILQRDKRFSAVQLAELKEKEKQEKISLKSKYESSLSEFMVERHLNDRNFAAKEFAKYQSQSAKRTAKHFASQSQTKQASLTNEQPATQINQPHVKLSPEEKRKNDAIKGLMKSQKCSFEHASKLLELMFSASQKES